MPKEPMSTFVAGGKEFEVVDKAGRETASFFDNYTVKRLFRDSSYISVLTDGNSDYTGLQGAAYNSLAEEYIIAICSSGDSSCMLIAIDMTDGVTVKRRKIIGEYNLGHANDITYNPKTNKYYVLTGMQTTYKNKIAVVDADTLEYESHIDLYPMNTEDNALCNWVIGYDSDKDVYYTASYSAIQIYNSNFVLENTVEYSPKNDTVKGTFGTYTPLVQCGCCYKGKLLIMNLSHGDNMPYTHSICLYDQYTGKLLKSLNNIVGFGADEEVEGVFSVDEVLYLIAGQTCYSVTQIVPSSKITFASGNDVFCSGVIIPNGADLNNYVLPGKYASISSSISSSLFNCPVRFGGFSLYVTNLANNSLKQTIDANYKDFDIKCVRAFAWNSTSSAFEFGEWEIVSQKYTDYVVETLPIESYVSAGFITSSGTQFDISIVCPKVFKTGFPLSKLSFSGKFIIRYNTEYIKDTDGTNEIKSSNCTITFYAPKGNTVHMIVKKSNGTVWHTDSSGTVNNVGISVNVSGTLTIGSN